jgi:hypothetical protein
MHLIGGADVEATSPRPLRGLINLTHPDCVELPSLECGVQPTGIAIAWPRQASHPLPARACTKPGCVSRPVGTVNMLHVYTCGSR